MAKRKIKKELQFEQSECPICLESWSQPCKLPCGHVFCFLCIKGSLLQKSECALCRTTINANFLNKPNIVRKIYILNHYMVRKTQLWSLVKPWKIVKRSIWNIFDIIRIQIIYIKIKLERLAHGQQNGI